MKKSFMTRVLATGLSLAMAFSLTAATNVTVASAASTPAMASKQFAVRVGGAAKSYKASAATRKSYKISKATVGNTDKATVKVNSSKKSIKVTPGTVAGSTVVKISFKNIKTKKTTSKKYRCVVKAAVVEKQAIVKAEATGVKTITLTMAKEVASVASPVAITVKKGASARPCTATSDGKTITLAMDAKLTAGDYTVTAKGLEAEDLTATVNVAKNETLTTYDISDYIVATDIGVSTAATIKYAALNQYGEKMLAGKPQSSTSFGDSDVTTTATATKDGTITVGNINAVLAIKGTKGTVTLVDQSGTGVNTTKEVTMSDMASAATVEYIGTYNTQKAKMQDIKENDKAAEYEALFVIKDQYGYEMDANSLNTRVSAYTGKTITGVRATVIGQLTNIKNAAAKDDESFSDRIVDGKDYVAVKLTHGNDGNTAKQGELTINLVNSYKGSLINQSIQVLKDVIIKSVNFTFENGVYDNEKENVIGYEITDDEGNSVTDYATLLNAAYDLADCLKMVRNADGTAKFLLNGTTDCFTAVSPTSGTDTASVPQNFTTQWNTPAGGNFLVKTTAFTLSQAHYAKTVSKLKADTKTSISINGNGSANGLKIGSDKILLADQYGGEINSDSKLFSKKVSYGAINVSGTSVYVDDGGVVTGASIVGGKKSFASGDALYFVPTGGKAGTATVYLKYCSANANDPRDDAKGKESAKATKNDYDYKFTVSVVDTESNDTPEYKLTINDGNVVHATTGGSVVKYFVKATEKALSGAGIEVTTTIGGQTVTIPSTQYRVVKNENNEISAEEIKKGVKTKTATLTVSVTTWDKVGNTVEKLVSANYDYSYDGKKIYKMDGIDGSAPNAEVSLPDITAPSTGIVTVTRAAFLGYFKYKDQYGDSVTSTTAISKLSDSIGAVDMNIDGVTFTVEKVYGENDGTRGNFNYTKDAQIEIDKDAKGNYYEYRVTAKAPNGSTKSVVVKFKVV